MDHFDLHAPFSPTGDQPEAIAKLVQGIRDGDHEQTLLGVTGSGKTYTIANVIAQVNKPTLVLAHNKILAAQLCSEFREFFPNNAVEYFVSYYDYYQPEAYIPSTDSYIEKDSSINDEIDKMRHSATAALAERKDVIIVASVSCIYSLGSPEEYRSMMVSIRVGMEKSRDQLIDQLVAIQYERNDINFVRNKFRVRGDVVEIFPASSTDKAIRVEYFGDEIDRICEINVVSGEVTATMQYAAILPASALCCGKRKSDQSCQRNTSGDAATGGVVLRQSQTDRSTANPTAYTVRHGNAGGNRFLQRHRKLFSCISRQTGRQCTLYVVRSLSGRFSIGGR